MEPTSVLSDPHTTAAPRGFTLIEMLVVLAIIAILTAIAVTGQSTFNKTLILTDTAYDVAFSARQAQSYGLSSRTFGSYTSQNYGYGLHFDRVTPNKYVFFADTSHALAVAGGCSVGIAGTPSYKVGNCRFDTADGIVSTYTFSRGFTISKFCGKSGTAAPVCSTDSSPLTTLDIVFTRPNTSTTINGLVNGTSLRTFTCAQLTLTDQSRQATKTIRISSLGEVSLNQTCP